MRVEGHYLEAELRRMIRDGNDREMHETFESSIEHTGVILKVLRAGDLITWFAVGAKDDTIVSIDVGLPGEGDRSASWHRNFRTLT